MRFNDRIQLTQTGSISDGMGGWIDVGEQIIESFDGFITPVKAEVMLKDYGYISNVVYKIFFKQATGTDLESIKNQRDVTVKARNHSHKIKQFADFGKYKMLLVERVED